MAKAYKSVTKLVYGTPEIKLLMDQFFVQYKEEIPLYLKDGYQKLGMESDPVLIFKHDSIEFNRINLDKGLVFVLKDEALTLIDYKLVADDERYIMYSAGRLFIFFKRNGTTPDTQAGIFEDFTMAQKGLDQVVDPAIKAAEIEELKKAAALEADEFEVIDAEEVKMEVTK
jgi:hypothetical protein